jgi:hypothetical protein
MTCYLYVRIARKLAQNVSLEISAIPMYPLNDVKLKVEMAQSTNEHHLISQT